MQWDYYLFAQTNVWAIGTKQKRLIEIRNRYTPGRSGFATNTGGANLHCASKLWPARSNWKSHANIFSTLFVSACKPIKLVRQTCSKDTTLIRTLYVQEQKSCFDCVARKKVILNKPIGEFVRHIHFIGNVERLFTQIGSTDTKFHCKIARSRIVWMIINLCSKTNFLDSFKR